MRLEPSLGIVGGELCEELDDGSAVDLGYRRYRERPRAVLRLDDIIYAGGVSPASRRGEGGGNLPVIYTWGACFPSIDTDEISNGAVKLNG